MTTWRPAILVILAFVLALGLVIFVGVLSYSNTRQYIEQADRLAHSRALLASLEAFHRNLVEAESGHRGYILTGDERFLDAYHSGIAEVPVEFASLRRLAAGDSGYQTRLDEIERLSNLKLNGLKERIELRKIEGPEAAQKAMRVGGGEELMNQIRRLVGEIRAKENESLRAEDADYRSRARAVNFSSVAGTTVSVLLMLGVFFFLNREVRQRALAAQFHRHLAAIVESAEDAIISKKLDGTILSWNPGAEQMLGYCAEEIIGQPSARLIPEDRSYEESKILEQIGRGQRISHFETLRRKKDGSRLDVLLTISPIRDERGIVVGVSKIMRDISEQKRSQEALRLANAYNRSLIEASLDPLVTISSEGKITDVNEATIQVTGVPREELIGTDFSNYFTEPEKAREGYQQVFSKGSVTDYPLTIRHVNGRLTRVLYNATVYTDVRGNMLGVFAAARDVTAQKKAEEDLRKLNAELEQRVADRTSRLEAANKELEAFTYSVSHDLRSPLRHIDGFSKILMEDFQSQLQPEAQRHLERIRAGTQQMGRLVDDLLNLTRVGRRELTLQVSGLNSIVQEALDDLKPETENRQIEWRISNLPFMECDPALMKQVFANLLSNAIKFTRIRERAVVEIGTLRHNGNSTVFVRDNGVGFNMKYADKLFGVFQRLHRSEDFEGTGVGLATVQRIIQKHGGQVWAEAELDKGATFYFSLGSQESLSQELSTNVRR